MGSSQLDSHQVASSVVPMQQKSNRKLRLCAINLARADAGETLIDPKWVGCVPALPPPLPPFGLVKRFFFIDLHFGPALECKQRP